MTRHSFPILTCLIAAVWFAGCDVPLNDSGEYFTCDEDGSCPSGYVCQPVEGTDACVPDDEADTTDISDAADTVTDDTGDVSDTTEDTGDISDTGPDDLVSSTTDLLFVIDNSGSMCDEQLAFSNSFREFADQIDFDKTDLQIGITTTHETPDGIPGDNFPAEYGVLQSQPRPLPGYTRECGRNFDVVTSLVDRAVECTRDPDNYAELREMADQNKDCIEDSSNCSGFRIESLFPPADAYRELPTVLKSEDYRTSTGFDLEGLIADFRCASLVGSRGWGVEKGLGAAVEAISREKLVEGDAPNSGFIREDSSFGVVFITDENDCTHNGGIDEQTACQDAVCEFENRPSLSAEDSDLVSIDQLRGELVENLNMAKSGDVTSTQVFAGGLYGEPVRFEGDTLDEQQCVSASRPLIEPTCESAIGSAKSGDRYQRFIRSFPEASQFPAAESAQTGKICLPDQLDETLGTLGTQFNAFLAQ